MGAALIQSGTETLSGLWALVIYLIPAGVGLGLLIAVILRRRRRRKKGARPTHAPTFEPKGDRNNSRKRAD